ncbi:mitochondrial fission factor isoform X11 [Ornithorhynchus anatinus]|uniref:mitochondrial fission factor isoform X11 n=1 Tax=Ornithorhynchus anatinus TaxID=9258 RepID=UPI0010A90B10|nr:mitochondrial fission factor isoform X11 [Ornithorhynchus anatinus]
MSKRASSESPLGRMSGAAFPSPTAEMAEMNRIQYEMEYTEGISQRMRVPEKLKVAPPNADLEQGLDEGIPNASVTMQVPERIVIAGNNDDIPFSRPADLGLIQSTPFKPLALKTPPRVLTLSERPLDFLDLERSVPPTPQTEDEKLHLEEEPCQQQIRAVGRLKRERSMSENAVRQNGQLVRNDSMWHRSDSAPRNKISRFQSSLSAPGYMAYQQVLDVLDENRSLRRQNEIRYERPVLRGGSAAATSSNPHHDVSSRRRAEPRTENVGERTQPRYGLSNLDTTIEGTSDDMTVVDAASLRRQIIKLNRRLQLLEEENKERAKREMVMYSITVAFWLLNSWLWFRR